MSLSPGKNLEQHLAFTHVAAFSLGRSWRGLSKEERQEYIEVFTHYIGLVNAVRMREFDIASLNIMSVNEAGKYDQLVLTHWQQPNQNPIQVEWRVRTIKGQHKVLDIVIEGLSMAQTLRDEFQAVIQKDGLQGLLKRMRQKIKQLG